MSHPSPDPAAVQRGAEIIENELTRSMIMPRPADTIRAILRMIDSAAEALAEPAGDDPYATAAGIAISLIDGYRRELAALGGAR